MTLSLYNLHSDPSSLYGYDDKVKNDPYFALTHAIAMGKRFPEGEKVMSQDASAWDDYQNFIKGKK